MIGPRRPREGEALALAFRGRPRTRFFGEPTAGTALARERVRLRDGVELRFETARFVDREGHLVDGPLAPDVPVSATARTDAGDSVTTAALVWVREQARAGR